MALEIYGPWAHATSRQNGGAHEIIYKQISRNTNYEYIAYIMTYIKIQISVK
jgi:hypothetical protein